ncbi:MAG: two-component regulator propeller domain-containing protein [Prolixibacteraceae bacterium]
MSVIKSIQLKVIFIFWIITYSLNTYALDNIVFEQLSTNDGLSNGTINSIFKDSRGFMWFCTDDGLCRYDGYTVNVYKSEFTEKNTPQNINFLAIIEDHFGRLWVGTSEGIYIYDFDSDRIIKFTDLTSIDLTYTPIYGTINCLLLDSYNYLWIGTYAGITRIKITNQDIHTINQEDVSVYTINSNRPISNNSISSIVEDQQHQIWVSSDSHKLDCFNYETNSFISTTIDIPHINQWEILAKKIKIDKHDNFWIATQGFGLIYWDRQKNIFKQYNTLSKDNEAIDIGFIRSLLIDKSDGLWIGTDGNGLVLMDKDKYRIKHFSKTKEDLSKISSNAIYSMFEDDNGIIWIGTYIMGLNIFVSDNVSFGAIYSSPYATTGLNNNLVTSFCEDKNKKIWISTDGGGLNVLDRNTSLFKHYQHEPNNPASLSVNATISLFCDRDNNIWAGSFSGGVNKFDQKTQKFTHYWHNPNDTTSISSNHAWGFAQDKANNIWVATVDLGLNLLKPGTTKFVRYTDMGASLMNPTNLCSNAITQLFIDKNNLLWIGTEFGLDMVDLNNVDFSLQRPKLIFKHYLPTETGNGLSYFRISCINEDPSGNIWIGTKGGGLNKLDVKTQTFTSYSVKDGLPHSEINGILFDKENNPWISTNNGISYFNIKTQKFKNYSTADGLQSTIFIKTACLKTSDGMFFFGGINGFNAFFPDQISPEIAELHPLITDFKLFNQSVSIGEEINERIILPKAINSLDQISLYYKENSIAFEFSALDYSNPEKIYYSYKLKGFDGEWQTTNAQMRIAKYTNLAPGEYLFSVRASTNEEIWPESSTSLSITIHPPWWMKFWFKLTSAATLLGVFTMLFMLRIYSLKNQKKILEKTVDEKTKQLIEANDTKDKFLSIIAHDLINPFHTILGFTDLLLTNFDEWDKKTNIETIKTINESSSDLYKLLNNLLEWSRSERGLIEYSPVKIDLKHCIQDIISVQSITAKAKQITFETNFTEDNCMVKSDEQLLNTILRNLLSNAIKFTPIGGKISIKTECHNNYMIVSVEDNGVGISKYKLENLFRIDISHSTLGTNKEKGTGLGLFLVKDFVLKQQGILNITSTEGLGSIFSFTIPLWKD